MEDQISKGSWWTCLILHITTPVAFMFPPYKLLRSGSASHLDISNTQMHI